MMKRFSFVAMLLAGLLLGGNSLGAEEAKKGDAEKKESVTYMLGQLIAAEPFSKLKFTDEERADLVKGFKEGLTAPMPKSELKAAKKGVDEMMREKMKELRAEENKKQQAEMAKLTFPMDTEIKSSGGETHTIASLTKGKKAILLDFWATWCGPCVRLMPELVKKEKKLKEYDIVVAGMNTEKDLEKAEKFRKENEIEMTWLVEPEGRPFSKLLKVNSIPRMVVVSPEGKILFNGHPMSKDLDDVLEGLGVTSK